MTTPPRELTWSGQGHSRVVSDAVGTPVGEVKIQQTPEGPRWFGIVHNKGEATPPEGRRTFAEAAEDLLAELE